MLPQNPEIPYQVDMVETGKARVRVWSDGRATFFTFDGVSMGFLDPEEIEALQAAGFLKPTKASSFSSFFSASKNSFLPQLPKPTNIWTIGCHKKTIDISQKED